MYHCKPSPTLAARMPALCHVLQLLHGYLHDGSWCSPELRSVMIMRLCYWLQANSKLDMKQKTTAAP